MKKLSFVVSLLLIAAVGAQAKLITKAVPYEHAGVKLEGYLAYDDQAKGSRPGVLVIPEWWGLNDYTKRRADELAKLGYVAFAVDMYGAGVVTEDAAKAKQLSGPFYGKPLMAERAHAALDQLLKVDSVDSKRVAVMGYCFGGTTALALAYDGAPLAAVITVHGGLIPAPAGALEKTHAKFLVLHGAIDPFVKPEDVQAFQKAMNEAKTDYQLVSYANAIHAFSNPDADRLAKKNNLDGIGYNEPAARRSWREVEAFLSETIGKR
ncbi:MAG TPA: dienelactone hydrolase family protein [Opitutaceae bacterium]|nr:dienelactone hydrolase family protein [Opitutaceae bacterium]